MPAPIRIEAHAGQDGETLTHLAEVVLPAEEVRYARAVLASHPAFLEIVLYHQPVAVWNLEDWDGAGEATSQPLVGLEVAKLHVRDDHCVLSYRPTHREVEFLSDRIPG